MQLTKEQKNQFVSELSAKLEDDKMVVMINYRGMKNDQINLLRDELAKAGIRLKVTKNSLFRLALKEKGIEIPDEILDLQLAIASAKDEVLPAKLINDFAKKNELPEIVGGILEKEFIDVGKVKILALLPSREELLAKMVGSIAAPTTSFVNVLAANIRGLVNVLNQYSTKKV